MNKRLLTLLTQGALPGVLVCALAFPADIFAQAVQYDHLVSPQAMQQQLEATAVARQRDIDTLNNFLSSPTAERAMQNAHINPTQVKSAIPTLSNEELANLATRAADTQMKFAAGSFSNDQLLIIILIIALVIVVVAAVH